MRAVNGNTRNAPRQNQEGNAREQIRDDEDIVCLQRGRRETAPSSPPPQDPYADNHRQLEYLTV